MHSAVDVNQQIWLELPDGSPYCLQLRNMNAQVLDGHPVSAVLVRVGDRGNGSVGLVCNLATGMVFDDPAFSQWLARTYTPSRMAAALLNLAVVGIAGGTMWSGMYLLGFILLFAGLAITGKIGRSIVEDKGQPIRKHTLRVNDRLVEEMEQRTRAEKAAIVQAGEGRAR
jgi:hypothetical protein